MLLHRLATLVLLLAWVGPAAAEGPGHIAVLELRGRVKQAELAVMSDQVRAGGVLVSTGWALGLPRSGRFDLGVDATLGEWVVFVPRATYGWAW